MPKVSIIVPVYNVENYIEKCLDSLLNQTLDDIEIIVVNDGSTDKSKEKILIYLEKYPNKIKYLEKKNGGLSSARNFGIPKATGKYIAFLDSDDYVEKDMYKTMYEKAEEEESDMVECDFIWEYPNKKRIDKGVIYNGKKEMLVKARVVAWNKLIRKSILDKAGVEFPEGLRYEDVEFFYKLLPYLDKVSFIKEPFIHYIQRGNSIVNTQNIRTKEIFIVLNNVLEYYKRNSLFEEYKEELEYTCARILLCSSLKRMMKISDKNERKQAIKETKEMLLENFPNWGENKILKQDKSLKNVYLRLMYELKFKKRETNNIARWLSLFVILCPILDMISFIFRNKFTTNLSPTTFLRPIIPTIVFVYYFFKENNKKKIIGIGLIYLLYSIIHLFLYKNLINGISYGGVVSEAQYLVNYSFMIVTLYVFLHTFKNQNTKCLQNAVLISLSIYIVSIFISIVGGSSSTTYLEGTGYKGWFESGNSLCTVLLLGICYIFTDLKNIKYKIWTAIVVTSIGIYLMFFSGMRTGLYGFILVMILFIVSVVLEAVLKNKKINKKIVILGIIVCIGFGIGVITLGSQTLERRKELVENQINNLDEETGEMRYVSGDILSLYKEIMNDKVSEEYIPKSIQNAIKRTCEYAEKTHMSNVDSRKQQLVYNYFLILEQRNPVLILFGNGYKTQFYELVLEMELPAFVFNFGVIGTILYVLPFIMIYLEGIWDFLKSFKKFSTKYCMSIIGLTLGLGLSIFAGYTFFNCSSMIMMVLLTNEIKKNKIKMDC